MILPPTAEDQVIEPEQVVDDTPITVSPLSDATNPGGLVEDLVVTVEGPNADRAEVHDDGTIDVTPGRERFAVAYRLTNELDDLDAMAFVIVPPVPSGDDEPVVEETQKPKTPEELAAEERAKFPAPFLKDIGQVIVPMNGQIEWSVADLVEVPSGKPALVLTASSTNAREPAFVDGATLRYAPAQDFRGEASLTFEVTDGANATDPIGRKAVLTIPITVGDPDFNDTPPTFTPRSETLEAGEAPIELDLRSSSDQPNPDNIERITYTNLAGTTGDINAEIVDGATLRVSSPLGVQPGAGDPAHVRRELQRVHACPATSTSRSSRRPVRCRRRTTTVRCTCSALRRCTVDVLANDFNPFAQDGVPLRVVAAAIDQVDVGSNASVSFTDTGITVRTGAAFTGTLSVIYRIQDGTRDAARETQGRVTVIVRDEPDAPNAPTIVSAASGAATVRWGAPATNNSPITRYEVSWNGGSQMFDASAAGVDQSIGGLTNGTAYTFTVRAENGIGWSAPSGGTTATPYGSRALRAT